MTIKNLSIFLFLVLLNAGCSEIIKPVDTAAEKQILYLGNGTEPQDLDPHVVTGVPESKILMALLEGLVIRHPNGLSPLPGIAEKWNVSNDGKTYTFFLRDNAIWSNGDPVTANDFVYSWRRMLTPSLGSKYPDMLYDVIGAEDFNKGLLKDFSKVGVKALDIGTLEVSLRNPAPYFLELLCHYTTRPVHRPTIEKFGEIDSLGSQWTRPGNFVGNGPFKLSSWELNKLLVVKKSLTYWDADNVQLNEIHFFPVDNATREDLMFRSGKLHVTSTVPQEKIEVYKEKYPENLKIDPYYGTYYYRFNTNKEPFDNKLVRQALSLSIDRKQIVDKVQKGGQAEAFSFTPPDKNAFYPSTKLEYDPVRARELLVQAGYEEGTFPSFELLYNTSEGHQKLAQAIQQMWKKNLNVDVTLTNTDWKVYLSKMSIGDFSVARAGWIGDYVDPKSFLDMMVTGRGNNQTGWSSNRYDSLLLKGANSSSQEERFSFFDEAEHILMDELPVLPIYTYTRIYMLHPDVQGWDSNLLDNHPYQYLSIRKNIK
jgi:oligopeptide transport system substrate-binding protein|tara:strand:- start:3119 stop:4735 length:1617 start_codon:yes stop_codon:yes gene_type:complete